MSEDVPLSYLSQIDAYVHAAATNSSRTNNTILGPATTAASNNAAAATSTTSTTTTAITATSAAPAAAAALPDCFRTQRCDSCEMLFDEAPSELRFTFPCGHVYCLACMSRADDAASRPHAPPVLCARCSNIIIRRRGAFPCTHRIPIVPFDVRRPEGFEARFPDRYRLALGQRTGPRCQLCWLVARLQSLTYSLGQRLDVRPFPGEAYVCVEVEGRTAVHGMMREMPDAVVDRGEDVEVRREPFLRELTQLASDLCGGLGQIPMEPHFDPRGHVVVKYRLRGWKAWVEGEGVDLLALPAGLRAMVFGDWI